VNCIDISVFLPISILELQFLLLVAKIVSFLFKSFMEI